MREKGKEKVAWIVHLTRMDAEASKYTILHETGKLLCGTLAQFYFLFFHFYFFILFVNLIY